MLPKRDCETDQGAQGRWKRGEDNAAAGRTIQVRTKRRSNARRRPGREASGGSRDNIARPHRHLIPPSMHPDNEKVVYDSQYQICHPIPNESLWPSSQYRRTETKEKTRFSRPNPGYYKRTNQRDKLATVNIHRSKAVEAENVYALGSPQQSYQSGKLLTCRDRNRNNIRTLNAGRYRVSSGFARWFARISNRKSRSEWLGRRSNDVEENK